MKIRTLIFLEMTGKRQIITLVCVFITVVLMYCLQEYKLEVHGAVKEDIDANGLQPLMNSLNQSDLSGNVTQKIFHFNRDYPAYFSLSYEDKVSLKKSQTILARIKDNCRQHNILTEWDFSNNFSKPRLLIAKPKRHILYGSNPKTGSTSFKKFLFILDGDFLHKDFHGKNFGHYKTVRSPVFFENKDNFEEYVKILSIRNPITRLMSMFRNKILRNHRYLKNTKNMTDIETFVKFIQYMKKTRIYLRDVHLKPQWKQMNICRFPYDLVMQFEDVKRYTSVMQHLTNTTEVEFPGSRVEVGKDTHDTMYYINEYLGALTDEEKNFIYGLYDMDFKILGYSKDGDATFPLLSYQDSV